MLDLSIVEGSVGPSPAVLDVLRSFSAQDVALLPSRDKQATLRLEIAKHHGLLPANVILGSGSDEIIEVAAKGKPTDPNLRAEVVSKVRDEGMSVAVASATYGFSSRRSTPGCGKAS